MNTKSESTYRLLVRSQEKGRTALEILIFVLCIFSVVVAIWQFAQTSLGNFRARCRVVHCLPDVSAKATGGKLMEAHPAPALGGASVSLHPRSGRG